MVSSTRGRRSGIACWTAILVNVLASSAYTPNPETPNRGILSSLIPIKGTSYDFTINQRRIFFSALVGALATGATRASTVSAEGMQPGVLESSDSTSVSGAIGILSTGYKLEAEQYQNIASSLSPTLKLTVLASDDDADSSYESLVRDADRVLNTAKSLRTKEKKAGGEIPLVLMGHSRGGCVVTLAAAVYLKAAIARSKNDKAYKLENSFPPEVLLILLDPVDTTDKIALHAIRDCLRATQTVPLQGKQSAVAKQIPSAWPWPVLIVSTPFGGSSSYYKVPYESACAPVSRNGDAFMMGFIGQNVDQKDQRESPTAVERESQPTGELIIPLTASLAIEANVKRGPSRVEKCSSRAGEWSTRILHVTLPEVGHTQLLDNRKVSTIGSVCAGNEKISDSDVRSMMILLINTWISCILNPKSDSDDASLLSPIDDIDRILGKAYPNIKTVWSR